MRPPVSGRVWLTTECPKDLADEFRARAQADERSVSGQIRLLIREYVATTSEGAPPQGASAKNGRGRDRAVAA
jgi:hypothetical protein